MAKPNKWEAVHDELEKKGEFDSYTTPFTTDDAALVDEKYQYLPKSVFFKLYRGFLRLIVTIFAPLVNTVGFGIRVKGRKNLKLIKDTGAISISNHVHYMDNLLIREAVSPYKDIYFTVAPHNCKKGFAGLTLKAGGVLPFSQNYTAKQNMTKAIHTLMERKKLVHVYAEKALWFRYEKPRPLKHGAFHFAYTEQVPILPIYVCWREQKGLRKLLKMKKGATVIIMEPMYPDLTIGRLDSVEKMKKEVEQKYIEKYREFYKVKGEIYLTDIKEPQIEK